jgi:hypothetical protein
MAARLTPVAERINVEAQRMILARPVDTLSGLAALLSVWPQLQEACRFGAMASAPQGNLSVCRTGPATLGQSEQFGTSNGARRLLQLSA